MLLVCTECTTAKEAAEYYRHPRALSGLMGICKDCHKTRMRIRGRTNPAVQEYDRQRAKTPKRKEHIRAVTTKWRADNPLAYKAQTAVNNAVRDRRLTKLACEFCGRTDVHAHHRDYSKPLEVVWLCPKCHHRLHAIFPETEGKMKSLPSG